MVKERQPDDEVVIKEYPNSTRWIEGKKLLGIGNLVLTSQRLVFLNRMVLAEKQMEHIQKLSEEDIVKESLEYALTLHKKNFEIPLATVLSVKTKVFAFLPFPRFYLRVSYTNVKKGNTKIASFLFTIPLLKGLFQTEIGITKGWESAIKRALRQKRRAG